MDSFASARQEGIHLQVLGKRGCRGSICKCHARGDAVDPFASAKQGEML